MQGQKCCVLWFSISYAICPLQIPTGRMHLSVPNLCLILKHVCLKRVRRKFKSFSGYSFGVQLTMVLQGFYLSGSACSHTNLPIHCHNNIKAHQPSLLLKSSCLDLFPCQKSCQLTYWSKQSSRTFLVTICMLRIPLQNQPYLHHSNKHFKYIENNINAFGDSWLDVNLAQIRVICFT